MLLEGDLQAVDLPTLLQWKGGDRVKIVLIKGDERGEIYLDTGKVIHAQVGGIEGEEAFCELLQWGEGKFIVEEGVSPKITLGEEVSFLLLKGAHILDEEFTDEDVEDEEEFQESPIDYEEVIRELEEIPSVKRARYLEEYSGTTGVHLLLRALEELEGARNFCMSSLVIRRYSSCLACSRWSSTSNMLRMVRDRALDVKIVSPETANSARSSCMSLAHS